MLWGVPAPRPQPSNLLSTNPRPTLFWHLLRKEVVKFLESPGVLARGHHAEPHNPLPQGPEDTHIFPDFSRTSRNSISARETLMWGEKRTGGSHGSKYHSLGPAHGGRGLAAKGQPWVGWGIYWTLAAEGSKVGRPGPWGITTSTGTPGDTFPKHLRDTDSTW